MDFSASPVSSQTYWTNWILFYSYFNDRAYSMIRRIRQIEKGAISSREICIIPHNNNQMTIVSGVDLFFIYIISTFQTF